MKNAWHWTRQRSPKKRIFIICSSLAIWKHTLLYHQLYFLLNYFTSCSNILLPAHYTLLKWKLLGIELARDHPIKGYLSFVHHWPFKNILHFIISFTSCSTTLHPAQIFYFLLTILYSNEKCKALYSREIVQ